MNVARRQRSDEIAVARWVKEQSEDAYRVRATFVEDQLYAIDVTQSNGDHVRYLLMVLTEQVDPATLRSAT